MFGAKSMRRIMEETPTEEIGIRQDILKRIALEAVYEAKNTLQQNQNINTGDLISDVGIKEEQKNSITIGTTKPQGFWIENGRPEVVASEGKVLHWIDKTTGEDVFAKRSGPTQPQPFMEPAALGATKKLPLFYSEKIEQSIKKKISMDREEL
jgi:hypothetical protein